MFIVITYPKHVSEQAGDYGQLQCNRLRRERKKTKNTKSSKNTKITTYESAEKGGKAKTTINNIVVHCHDDVTHLDEVHEDYFIDKNGSEMKHIQKDYEIKSRRRVTRHSPPTRTLRLLARRTMKTTQSRQS